MAKGKTEESVSGWLMALGVLFMLFGLVMIVHPIASTFAVAMLFGLLILFCGIAQIVFAFLAKKWSGFMLALLLGLVFLVAGGVLLFSPLHGVLTLTLLLGAFMLVAGCIKIAMSQAMKAWANSGWLMFDGFLSILLGVLIIMAWPSDSVWVMGLLVGINLLFGGITYLLLGMAEKEG
ncbi:Uncharacterised protein [Candidatus Burarchaeum australiense]|nr:Uncharacterised protein [Candidatus Burarchaeum australiense]